MQSAATVAADGKSSRGSKEMRNSTFIPAAQLGQQAPPVDYTDGLNGA